jgi:cytochrome P450
MKQRNENLLFAAGALALIGAGAAAGRMLSRSTVRTDTTGALPKASLLDTLALALDVFVPNVAKGVIIRRPKVVAMAEQMELDRRAVQRMQKLRTTYGRGPLMLRLPLRNQAVVLAPEHVHRVLNQSPEPFATASSEKRSALAHFEPKGALISHGPERTVRRRFNEEVLGHEHSVHRLVESFLPVVDEEAQRILASAQARGELDWNGFSEGWFRLVRRVVFGNSASEDHEFNDLTVQLRRAGNWGFLRPRQSAVQERFFARIKEYLDRAEPGSLAAVIESAPKTEETMPHHQVPQWLFAFDPAGMTTFRALALLAAHPEQASRAQEEVRSNPGIKRQDLPFLRATVLESLRLWPTTPLVLRQTTRETRWEDGTMPAKTGILIFAPFFHRDDQRLAYADRFTPELWLKQRTDQDWPLIPFSAGPAICPGRNLVLLLTSAMLAALIDQRSLRLVPSDRLDPARLPGTLDNYSLRFRLGRSS